MKNYPYARYYDKVLAAWLGKSLGGAVGVPFENHKQYSDIAEDKLWPASVGPNDDLDIQIVWLEAMLERGLYLTGKDLAEYWQDRCWYNFCEYGFFLHNIQRGIAPPVSGSWNNDFFHESEGCPIRSEIWGCVAPGNPELAAEYARIDGSLDHDGASVDIECFLAACAAQAFLSDDLESVLTAGLRVVPQDSMTARVVSEVREICRRYPAPRDAWRLIIRRYGDRDASKAITNHALTLMALFLGGGNFKYTMNLCVNAGWDADCTAATAGALLGIMHGSAALPADWVKNLGPTLICGIRVEHQTAPLAQIAELTCRLGVEMSAARNPVLRFENAPEVAVRPAPAPRPLIRAEYPTVPVLRRERPTPVWLVVENPTSETISAPLRVTGDANICLTPAEWTLSLKPGETRTLELEVRRKNPELPLADRNLFQAVWGDTVCNFGLGGARQWRLYGPYWDMWDVEKSAECPYQNERIVCNPGCVNCWSDFYNQYLRFDHPYLDEAALLLRDLPEELPETVEIGPDRITEQDLGGFHGQGCYYLVREFSSGDVTGDVRFFIGRSGPCKVWLDGKLIAQSNDLRSWAPHEDEGFSCTLTGGKQRLVIKLLRLTDAMSVSPLFIHPVEPGIRPGISYIIDTIMDL